MPTYPTLSEFDFPTSFIVADSTHVISSDGDIGAVRDWRSVTKPVFAWAVLVAIEGGHIGLDDAAGLEGATVRHLLAHASGLPMEDGGRPTSVERRRIYSNVGFRTLADHLAEAVGTDFHTWTGDQVLTPLDMESVTFEGTAAEGMAGSTADMLTFGYEMLHPTLISEDLAKQARTVQFPGLDGVLPGYGRHTNNDWGLGMEIRSAKNPHWTATSASEATFGHFGQSGSFLWVDPDAALIGAFLGDKDFSEQVHGKLWSVLNDEVYAAVR